MSFHHPCSAQDKCLHFHPDHILLLQLLPTWNLVYSADTFVTFSSMSYRDEFLLPYDLPHYDAVQRSIFSVDETELLLLHLI